MSGALARLSVAVAGALLLAACQDRGEVSPDNTARLHFGDVYVGLVESKNAGIKANNNIPVSIDGFTIEGTHARRFLVVDPIIPPSAVVDASSPLPLRVTFWPNEARQYRGVTLTPVVSGARTVGFPIDLLGNGVWQKRDIWLSIRQTTNPANNALDFGRVELDQVVERDFIVQNTHTQPLTLTMNWIKPDSEITTDTTTIDIPAQIGGVPGEATVTFRFRPTVVRRAHAVAQLESLPSFAGTVLVGEGIPARATAGGVTFSPQTIDPGQTIDVTFSVTHPDGLQAVTSATIEGLPSNAPGGSTQVLRLPTQENTPSTTTLSIGPPAMDGVYPLRLVIKHTVAADLEIPLGNLTVRDVPATIDSVVVRADSHRRCETGLVGRVVEYRVSDNNGATDIVNPKIEEIQPPGAFPPLAHWRTTPLLLPRNERQTSETVTTDLNFFCNAKDGDWALIVRVDEDDKTITPPALFANFRHALPYRVLP